MDHLYTLHPAAANFPFSVSFYSSFQLLMHKLYRNPLRNVVYYEYLAKCERRNPLLFTHRK
jgi:hypothetical protein